ncbi:porin [Noviherbaspirillum cavernae]|uniref:Porin n=1 Tax=Noviherbaspirillum cavernae TaxID=2320862 RepID=A0A418WWI8_9BURK|nr:porin [Noviherbaspirillum cavernae]RJG04626.1 porin [Noviherbaspirillum cavernae]RJG07709.1 porin [Noviherbaspirillum cavernae]
MKKSVLALAVLGAISTGAFAQTNVSVYGLLDVGIVQERGGAAGSVTKLTSGVGAGSRLGFKGTEDLGGGLSALFVLENGYQADTGALGQGGLMFGRQAFVGLGSTNFGTVTLGRQYTPQYLTVAFVDPFGTGFAGNANNILPQTGNATSRMDNSVKYVSPNFSGFTGEVAYGFGEVAGSTSTARQYGLAVGYANGPLAVRLGYHNLNNGTAAAPAIGTENAKNTLLGATYDFKVAKAHLAYGVDKGLNSSKYRNAVNPFTGLAQSGSTDSTDVLVGVTVPFGAHKVLASYIHKNDKTANNMDANQYALGYIYSLSKRTELYTTYAKISNKNGAGYTVGGAIEAGSGDQAFNAGIRHAF